MNPRNQAGFTLTECIVILGIILILALLPPIRCGSSSLVSAQMLQTLSNMRQLQLATQSMALDGETTDDKNLGWPGDTGGSYSNWVTQLVKADYMKKSDLCRMLSAPGMEITSGKVPTTNNTAFRVYAIREESPTNAVFLTTANFTNTPEGGEQLSKTAKPYGTNGFVVLRKNGEGDILKSQQVGQINVIGTYVPLCW